MEQTKDNKKSFVTENYTTHKVLHKKYLLTLTATIHVLKSFCYECNSCKMYIKQEHLGSSAKANCSRAVVQIPSAVAKLGALTILVMVDLLVVS